MKKLSLVLLVVLLASAVLTACAPAQAPTPEKVVETVIVEKPGETVIQVVTPTPEPKQKKLEIFHWWTAPGEREAADAMFKAFHDKYPDIQVVENPVPGGGGVSHRVVLQSRIIAGIPPDT
ncbi:MAG: ABC transporter substrate-binding protein, partial [Anaerolineales bacterium]